MTKTQEIPADVMAEAKKLLNDIVKPDYVRSDALVFVFRALLARDTAARKECLEKLRELHRLEHSKLGEMLLDKSLEGLSAANWQGGKCNGIATAIEATIGGQSA